MKASKMLINTLKEAPSEAIIPSHIYLLRAGMIRQLVAGVYNYMPLGLRSLHKIENIIREEMDRAGALEILSSALQPKELWEESGRWYKYGPELMRMKDRHEREFCLGPTHEEVFTYLARNEIKSYKNLPLNLYQIQHKYRDEMRPRFGLMRSREFLMKDAYSFDLDEKGLEVSYENMKQTYQRIFDRLHLNYKIVLADTGAIGGNGSHQFMAISDVGESNIIYCNCGYAADEEKASSVAEPIHQDDKEEKLEEVLTVNQKSIEEVSSFLGASPKEFAKSLVYCAAGKYIMAITRGDRFVNEIKLANALGVAEFELRLASDGEVAELGTAVGFVGPVGTSLPVYIDEEVANQKNLIAGANKKDYHLKNVNMGRDFKATVVDIRTAMEGDKCPVCGKPMLKEKGIEVGQIFKLGTKYSASMGCTYLSQNGENKPMIMGCYGIGVSRSLQSVIDQYHDDFGICFPVNVAPYEVVVIPTDYSDPTIKEVADKITEELEKARIEVVEDDRDAKPGFKFKDWDLIGIPYHIVVGRGVANGNVEFKIRNGNIKEEVAIDKIVAKVKPLVEENR